MATILYRYAVYKGYDVTESGDLSGYTDADGISAYAKDAMAWANSEGLITGVTDTTLNPKGTATRAQVATILMRFRENAAASEQRQPAGHKKQIQEYILHCIDIVRESAAYIPVKSAHFHRFNGGFYCFAN